MDDPLIGKVLCGYRFERLLVRGEGESVYLASQLSVARAVVAKVLLLRPADRKDTVAEFLAHARRAGRLKHPGIVELHEVCQQDEVIFYTMEYLPGGTLTQWVTRNGPVSVRQYWRRLGVVVDALVYAEGEGIVHGRLDPDHLLIARDGSLKVLGLGLGELDPTEGHPLRGPSELRLACLAPELVRTGASRRTADTTSDVYSFGCTSYFALTGKPPFRGGTPEEVLAAKRLHKLTPILQLRPGIPPELASLVETAMALTPERRAPDFRHVQSTLRSLSESLFVPREPPEGSAGPRAVTEPREAGRRALRFTLGIAGLLAVAVLCAYLIVGPGPGTTVPPPVEPRGEETRPEGAVPPPDAASADASRARAAVTRVRALLQDGQYREALDELARLKFQLPQETALLERTKSDVVSGARSELRGVLAQVDGHLALREYGKALRALEGLAARLPEDLAGEAESRIREVDEARWNAGFDGALRVISSQLATLDFVGARATLEAVEVGGRSERADRRARAREEVRNAKELFSRLDSASVSAWTDLSAEFPRSYSGEDAFSFAAFRAALLRVAGNLLRVEIERTKGTSLFHGAYRALEGSGFELSYDFSTTEQLADFRPLGGEGTRLRLEDGRLRLQGECRFLEGDPLRGSLEVTLEVAEYDEENPNINIALWTPSGGRISYREGAEDSGDAAPATRTQPSSSLVAFCAGYSLSTPLAHYLRVKGSSQELLFPCHAIFRNPRGGWLHSQLRFECDWGRDLFPVGLKGVRSLELSVTPDLFHWIVQGSPLHEEVPPKLAAQIRESASGAPSGSVTIFTNGSDVVLDSLSIRGRLDSGWIQAEVRKLALQQLTARFEDLPWEEALTP